MDVGQRVCGMESAIRPNPAAAFVEVLPDASINLMVGCADIGQGSTTTMAQIAAEELGVAYESVNVTAADTAVTPEGGATSASRQTFISGNATPKCLQNGQGDSGGNSSSLFGDVSRGTDLLER